MRLAHLRWLILGLAVSLDDDQLPGPAGAKAVARCFPAQRRGMAMAVFDSSAALGAVLAPPLVALLALQFGWRAAFAGTAVIDGRELYRRIFERIPSTLATCRFPLGAREDARSVWTDGCGRREVNNPSYEKGRKELMKAMGLG